MTDRRSLTTADLEELARKYAAGDSHDKLGAELGMSGNGVRYHLRKLPNYRRMVDKVLMLRITRAQGRPLKHAIAMLRRHRPRLYARWLVRGAPKLPNPQRIGQEWRSDCPKCLTAKHVYANRDGRRWAWQCIACGASGQA